MNQKNYKLSVFGLTLALVAMLVVAPVPNYEMKYAISRGRNGLQDIEYY
jgi:hypothetical protein